VLYKIYCFHTEHSNREESRKKVVHFIGLFERGDDKNKPSVEKNILK